MVSNGRLDLRTLTQVDGWAYLAPATAASWNAACAEMVALGYPRPTITAPDGAYRTYNQQVYWKAYWTGRGLPGNAATPGFSNHGWGTAVDIHNVARFYRPDLVRVFSKYGFTFNVPSEAWHIQHNNTWPASGGGFSPIPTEEEDMPTYELVQTPDGTVWFCVDRVHRYGIPSEAVLNDYKFFIRSKGQSDVVGKQGNADAFGSPVFRNGTPAIGTPTAAQIATAVKNALGDVSGGEAMTPAQIETLANSIAGKLEVPTVEEIATGVRERIIAPE